MIVEKFQKRKMHNHTFGEVFERDTPRVARPSRAATRVRRSYDEDVIAPSFEEGEDNGIPNASSFPCTDFLHNAGLLDDFLFLINRAGLSTYMEDEREIPLPQADLFSIRRRPWSRTKEEVDEQLRILSFHQQHDSEDAEPSGGYTVTYPGASSSYQGEDPPSSYYGGATSWAPWD
jgi:hypothetical protein